MFKMKNVVRKSLEENLRLRDNDNLLISHIIRTCEGKKLAEMSAYELLDAIEEGRYGSFEGMRRARQKWQELDLRLRGEKWKKRQAHQGRVRKQLQLWGDDA